MVDGNVDADRPSYGILTRAAERAGIDMSNETLIRNGSNVMYRIDDLVARIGRPGTAPNAAKEVRVSAWLRSKEIAAVEVSPVATEQPVVVDGRPVTFWKILPQHRASTPGELGTMIRRLHLLPVDSIELPALDPFHRMRETIEGAAVSADRRDFLTRHLAKLRADYAHIQADIRMAILHGDAWQGNCVVPAGGPPTFVDLEAFCVGPAAWDLVNLAADYVDFDRLTSAEYAEFVAGYGHDVTTSPDFGLLASIQELRWACFALRVAETEPRHRAEALHRIACLRGEVPRPWTWSAI